MFIQLLLLGITGYYALVFLLIKFVPNNPYSIFSILCATVWVCIVIYLTFLMRCPVLETRIHLIPFLDAQFYGLLENAVLFLPFGSILTGLLPRIKVRTCIMAGVFTSLLIELVQLLSHRGICDMDDLIANSIGVVLGEILFVIIRQCAHPSGKTT